MKDQLALMSPAPAITRASNKTNRPFTHFGGIGCAVIAEGAPRSALCKSVGPECRLTPTDGSWAWLRLGLGASITSGMQPWHTHVSAPNVTPSKSRVFNSA